MKQTNVTWINIYWYTLFNLSTTTNNLNKVHLNQINTIKLSLLYINSYKHIHNMCVKKPNWNQRMKYKKKIQIYKSDSLQSKFDTSLI
jgi:hypothetical protein